MTVTDNLGLLASVASPLLMSIGFILYDKQWKGSSFSLNLFKGVSNAPMFSLAIIISFYAASHETNGGPFEVWHLLHSSDWMKLLLSSMLGIVVGDTLWLQGLQILGAHKVILIDSLKPFMAAFLGWLIMGEDLSAKHIAGMVITMIGVLCVALSPLQGCCGKQLCGQKKQNNPDDLRGGGDVEQHTSLKGVEELELAVQESKTEQPREEKKADGVDAAKAKNMASRSLMGCICSGLNVFFDVYGAILVKQSSGDLRAWDIGLIRFSFATVVLFLISIPFRWRYCCSKSREYSVAASEPSKSTSSNDSSRWFLMPSMPCRNWGHILCGVVFISFLAPALNNFAVFRLDLGVYMTLTSLGPIFSLPMCYFMKNDAIYLSSVLGSFVACGGVAIVSFA